MTNQSRRTLLKGIGYSITTLAAGLGSTAAMAAFSKPEKVAKTVETMASGLPSCDITIYQHQSSGKEIVSLMNLTDDAITLDNITPVGLEHVNGSLKVKVNRVNNGAITIEAGERLSFEVEAISANLIHDDDAIPNVLAGHLRLQSDHPDFNGIIPVTVFDAQVA